MEKKASTKIKKGEYFEAVGRRKTSVARVRVSKATQPIVVEGADFTPALELFVVNEKPVTAYFPLKNHHRVVVSPFQKADLLGQYSVSVKVSGGGVSSQAFAVRHGIARALVTLNEELRKKLKRFGYLTRDPRMVERKKYGLKKARRAPQWSKR
jgi:small subunit ribosomal protein S9